MQVVSAFSNKCLTMEDSKLFSEEGTAWLHSVPTNKFQTWEAVISDTSSPPCQSAPSCSWVTRRLENSFQSLFWVSMRNTECRWRKNIQLSWKHIAKWILCCYSEMSYIIFSAKGEGHPLHTLSTPSRDLGIVTPQNHRACLIFFNPQNLEISLQVNARYTFLSFRVVETITINDIGPCSEGIYNQVLNFIFIYSCT